MGRVAMMYTLFLFISWFSTAGALSLSFPNGKPIAASKSQNVSWQRDKHDPKDQFFFQKIKLDEPGGPTVKSTPVPVPGSENDKGTSPFAFNRAGLFEVLAVNVQNGQPFWTTELTVAPNPTSGASPQPTSGSSDKNSGSNNMKMGSNSSSSDSNSKSSTTTTTSASTSPTQSASDTLATSANHSPSSHSISAIIGAVLGSVALFFILGVLLLCFRYRTRRATTNFARDKMVRAYNPSLDKVGTGWSIPSSEEEKTFIDNRFSLPPTRRSSLRPLDSVSNIGFNDRPILPPIPVARSIQGSDVSSSASSSSTARRTREKNTLRLSVSTLSTSTSTSDSLFHVPSLPPRTRTDRQMMIEEDIQRLQARMLLLQGSGNVSPVSRLEREEELKQIDTKVDRLKAVHESRWALGLTDEVPDGLF